MTDLAYQWNNGASLTTSGGTATFVTGGDGLHLDPDRCVATQVVRQSFTRIPQGDGVYVHDGFFGEVLITLAGVVVAEAGDGARTTLVDGFVATCRGCLRSDGTFSWNPSGAGARTTTVRLYDGPELGGTKLKTFRVTLYAASP